MWKSLTLISSLLALSLAKCPPGSLSNVQFNRCYMYVVHPETFSAAAQNCNNFGGHLVSIRNDFENTLVSENAQSTPGITRKFFWIGANQLKTTQFTWTDGQPFSYYNWAPKEPNAANKCGASEAGDGIWKTVDCNQAQPYVCVVPEVPEPVAARLAITSKLMNE